MKKVKEQSGFTLIEMLAVVALIAILIAITTYSLQTSREMALEGADVANIRNCYSIWQTKVMDGSADTSSVKNIEGFLGLCDATAIYADKITYTPPTTEETGELKYTPNSLNGGKTYSWELAPGSK